MTNKERDIETKAQENLQKFHEWYVRFKKACEAIDITEKQAGIFLDILGGK